MGSVEDSLRTVRLIKRINPTATILARARDRRHAWQLMDFGVTPIRETFFSALRTGRDALVALGMPPEIADDRMRRFKAADERVLAAQHLVYDDEDALKQTSADARKELEQLFAADLGEGLLGSAAKDAGAEEEALLPAP
jgi:glutathione-regulated potassium-efflux system protein KefB